MDATIINALEDQITKSEKVIRKAEALKRLRMNPDFIQIIEQDYLREQAIELALFRGSITCTGTLAEDADKGIIGIGQFNDYLKSISRNAEIAEQSIAACRAEIVAIETNENEEEFN